MTSLIRRLMQDPQFRKKLGNRIKQLRKKFGWTQKELANKIGVRFELLNKYEGGQSAPSIERLPVIALSLETTVDFLLTGATDDNFQLHDQKLLNMFRELEAFDKRDRQTAIELIDALIVKRKVQGVVRGN